MSPKATHATTYNNIMIIGHDGQVVLQIEGSYHWKYRT